MPKAEILWLTPLVVGRNLRYVRKLGEATGGEQANSNAEAAEDSQARRHTDG